MTSRLDALTFHDNAKWNEDFISRAVPISGYLGVVSYDPEYSQFQGLWRPYDYKQIDKSWLELASCKDRLGIYVIGPQENGINFPFVDDLVDADERINKITQIKTAAMDKYNEHMRSAALRDRSEVIEREHQIPCGKKTYGKPQKEPVGCLGDIGLVDSTRCAQQ